MTKKTAVAAGKGCRRQQLFGVRQAPPHADIAVDRVVDEVVANDLYIADVGDADMVAALGVADVQVAAAAQRNARPDAVHHGRKCGVRNGLDQKIERKHLIPLERELLEVGDEHERNLGVECAQPLGRLHAVHVRHFDVHEDDVCIPLVLFKKIQTIAEHRHAERLAALFAITLQISADARRLCRVIFYDRNSDHTLLPPVPSAPIIPPVCSNCNTRREIYCPSSAVMLHLTC